jgi:hypothetical protein
MPTMPRRPAAQQARNRLEARRLRAAELFAVGVRRAKVARQLGVSPSGRQRLAPPLGGRWHAGAP